MINERFIELLTKDLVGEITAEEKIELTYLTGEDDLSRKEAELYKMYWKRSKENKIDSKAVFEKVKAKISEKETIPESFGGSLNTDNYKETKSVKLVRFSLLLKIAAVFFIAISSLVVYRNYSNKDGISERGDDWVVKITPRGVKSTFILPDGTRIALNSGSKLEYPKQFEGNLREVYLIGEGFFEVMKDKKHPFIIHTAKMNIKVLGTAFNVKSYPEESTTETTLIRGSIAVTLNDRPSERIILKPSQKLVILNNEEAKQITPKHLNKIGAAELTTITYYRDNDTTIVETSWLNNKLIFKNEDFNTVAKKMERWYNVDIKFSHEQTKGLKFTGVFENETVEEALRALQLTEDFDFKINKSTVEIN